MGNGALAVTPQHLLSELARHGVSITVEGDRLKVSAHAPPPAHLLEAAKACKPDLIRLLTGQTTGPERETEPARMLPCLPWQLERLLSAASNDLFIFRLPGVLDVNRYVLAWATAYLTSDRDEALKRLWQAYHAWRGCVEP